MIYQWREISRVPFEPGVYAWYYSPEITTFDLERVVTDVERLKVAGDRTAAAESVRHFLNEYLFRYFHEDPYQLTLRGPLKPRYEGSVEHRPALSESLVERLVEEPRRLATIKQVLESSAPFFASPIYIGMSEKLGSRLARHKALIEKYGTFPPEYKVESSAMVESEKRDHGFAQQIRARNIAPTRLFVVIQVISGSGGEYVDIENILNRIHYPLLGRN